MGLGQVSITRKQMERDARDIIINHSDNIEFSDVYEDESIADNYTGKEQRELFDLILRANIAITWKDSE